jgi:KDO2-lipid IV(A) lauroyltransferase
LRFGAIRHWLQNCAAALVLGTLLALPYRLRVPLCGWLMARLVAPLAGYDRRVRDNLRLVLPGLPAAEVQRLARAVPDNLGRTLIEIYSGAAFAARARRAPLQGPGLAALEGARAARRPVILVTAHFGNYDAIRAALIGRGFAVGALYRPMTNRYFNRHYVRAVERIGTPIFARGRQGMAQMLRFLRGGGALGMLIDQHMAHGARLRFFGRPALTALSAAELALKYNALLIPTYAVRGGDGLDFEIVLEAPLAPGTPEAMTQALNDSLEAQVRAHPEQWLWIHRRWRA